MSGRVVRWPLRERVNDRGKPVTVHEGRFVPAHHAVDETTGILESVFGCRSSDPRLVRGAGFHQERRPHCRDVARERALITAELERLENEVPVGLLNHF